MTDQPALRVRTSRIALLGVLALFVCVTPVAAATLWLLILYVVPLAIGFWVLRAGADIDTEGITVRAVFGQRRYSWSQVRGVTVDARGALLLALDGDRLVRVPVARSRDLEAISEASGGHIPAVG